MTDAYIFAQVCPSFTVDRLEVFISSFGNRDVSRDSLESLDFLECSRWLSANLNRWKIFKALWERSFKKYELGQTHILRWGDLNYPLGLKFLSQPPPILFYRGEIFNDKLSVGVVGARNPTSIGRLWVQKVVPELVGKNIAIVSGGARGIDGEAHWSCVECGGKTVAFLPGSVDDPYPHGNRDIFDKILETGGSLVSEFMSGTEVRRENFHRRNRLIAGLSDVTIIVEAGEKSGTLLTATKALAENRDILVVPGPPLVASYTGSLELIYQGAGLARDGNDIIFALMKKNVLKM